MRKWCHVPRLCLGHRKWHINISFLKDPLLGLPWWLSDKECAYQCRGHGFDPWYGIIPHAPEQRSPCTTTISRCSRAVELQLPSPHATTTEACMPKRMLHNKRSRSNEKPTHLELIPQLESSSPFLQQEKNPCSNEHPAQHK